MRKYRGIYIASTPILAQGNRGEKMNVTELEASGCGGIEKQGDTGFLQPEDGQLKPKKRQSLFSLHLLLWALKTRGFFYWAPPGAGHAPSYPDILTR